MLCDDGKGDMNKPGRWIFDVAVLVAVFSAIRLAVA